MSRFAAPLFVSLSIFVLGVAPGCSASDASEEDDSAAVRTTGDLFGASDVLGMTLRAPMEELFRASDAASDDTKPEVDGELTVGNEKVAVRIRRRGNSSTVSGECSFPKLKVKLPQGAPGIFGKLRSFDLNTHCGEARADKRTPYGRVANELSPLREELAYRMVRALGVPTYRTRLSRLTYEDTSANARTGSLTRNALVIESKDVALARFIAEGIVPAGSIQHELSTEANPEGSANPDLIQEDRVADVHFAEALIGNRDFSLRRELEAPERWLEEQPIFGPPIWNLDVFGTESAQLAVPQDFDLAALVAPHKKSLDEAKRFTSTPAEGAVFYHLQRARLELSHDALDRALARLAKKRAQVEGAARGEGLTLDPETRATAEAHVRAFFDHLTPSKFYVPVVTSEGLSVLDKQGNANERCLAEIPPGTPAVTTGRTANGLVEVAVLDVKDYLPCVRGPFWVKSPITIGTDFPRR